MPLLDALPASIDEKAFRRALRLSEDEGGAAAAAEILGAAVPLLRPRAYFRDDFVDARDIGGVTIGGRAFRSRVLRANLDTIERVFPYLLTVGGELERAAAAQDDLLRQYAFETAADMAIHAAGARLEAHIRRVFGTGSLSAMSPGSLTDWPLEEQGPLFALLGDGAEKLGVRLTESFLMVPRKSVSGILFASEEAFTSCALCPRPRCPGRRAAFDPEKRAAFGLED
ncbi:MAG: vitamin B12 dependent-methionine synthase activation domain-containing protein [Acidobacteriota bacterium]|nr:vitamin B12 dependent-methionine synthase activation domain-containing protein [Acidobacteriota bacterium]